MTELYNPKAFLTHAALLRQAFAHCAIFPTAASRRSLDRVSVPVWGIILSDPLYIVAMVGHYPTIKLMYRRPFSKQLHMQRLSLVIYFQIRLPHPVLASVSRCCPRLRGRSPTCYSPVRHYTHSRRNFLVRLACIKHAASVRSEPGSNSPSKLYNKFN
jgi:hypothetical protein